MSDVFTSDAACRSVARRTVRAVGENNYAPIRAIGERILPVSKQIVERGKLPRNAMPSIFQGILKALRDTPNIVDVASGRYKTGELGLFDGYMVRYVAMISDRKDEWLHFVTCETKMGRHFITTRIAGTEFRVHHHALMRYMRREQRDLKEFFSGITDTLRAAMLIGAGTMLIEQGATAVPFRDGLLLGNTAYVPEDLHPKVYPVEFSYDRNGPTEKHHPLDLLVPGRVPFIEMKTFVDGDSLSPRKEALRDAIRGWVTACREGIDITSSTMMFGSAAIPMGQTQETMTATASAAIKGVRDLVRGEAWQDFADHADA